jgi:putative membrane protein
MTERQDGPALDPTRRTWLASERTWLAWWRTGVGAAAVAVGVGRVLPEITVGADWPFRVLGAGYAVLAIWVLVAGASRQRHVDAALAAGSYHRLSPRLATALTAAAVVLAVLTLVLVVAG